MMTGKHVATSPHFVTGVLSNELASGGAWPQISSLISQAIPRGRGEYTLEDVREGLARGDMLAVGVANDRAELEFVATCTLCVYPRKRVLYVQYGAGRGGKRALSALVDAARILNCDWVETRSSPAVARLYAQCGFDTAYTVSILEVGNELQG